MRVEQGRVIRNDQGRPELRSVVDTAKFKLTVAVEELRAEAGTTKRLSATEPAAAPKTSQEESKRSYRQGAI